jgi:LmbE family N-acetylglucosaminyl deacetylase
VRTDARVPRTVLAVYAHPDDPEVACGGSLAQWVDRGAQAHVLIVNRGDKGSSSPDVDPDELAAERAAEVTEAAGELGLASFALLGRPDGESENDLELRGRLVEVVRGLRPDTVVCPDPTALFFGAGYVNHRDHRVCGAAVLDAVAPAAASPLYFPDAAVDIGAVLDRTTAALACHRSQLGEGREWVNELVAQRAADAGRGQGLRYAEVFRVLRLA